MKKTVFIFYCGGISTKCGNLELSLNVESVELIVNYSCWDITHQLCEGGGPVSLSETLTFLAYLDFD